MNGHDNRMHAIWKQEIKLNTDCEEWLNSLVKEFKKFVSVVYLNLKIANCKCANYTERSFIVEGPVSWRYQLL